MKNRKIKYSLYLTFLLCSFSCLAHAEIVELKKHSIEIPSTYTVTQTDKGLFLQSQDHSEQMIISLLPHSTHSLEEYTQALAEEFAGKNVEQVSETSYSFKLMTPNKQIAIAQVMQVDKDFLLVFMEEKHQAELDTILESIE